MTEQATIVAPADDARGPVALGSFLLGARQVEEQRRLDGVALFAARGLPDTAYAGIDAFVYCAPVSEHDPTAAGRMAKQRLAPRMLASDSIVHVYEAGLAGNVAYVIEEVPFGERLSAWLTRNRRATPWVTSGFVGDLAAAIQAAHDTGISHGKLVPAVAWVDDQGKCKLGGFGLAGNGAWQDQRQLALLTLELLAGAPFDPELLRGLSTPFIAERVRSHVSGLTERVALVIATALQTEPAAGFASVAEYAVTLRSEIVTAATDLSAGAWEALSLRDTAMAGVLINKIADYDPASSELPLLRVRTNDAMIDDPGAAMMLFAQRKANGMEVTSADAPTATSQPVPGEFAEDDYAAAVKMLLTPPAAVLAQPTASNPWYVLVIGICVMVIILTVLTALTLAKV